MPGDGKNEATKEHWKVDLMRTCTADPGWCCLSLFCGCCVSYQLRKRALYNDMSRYVCCGGYLPCSGRCGEQSCPEFCLAMEAWLCFGQSVASTRWMLQDEMHIQNTDCDNCIIATMVFFQYLSCICWLAACITGSGEINDIAQIIDNIADCLWVSVCACMQTQHKVQLDERDRNPGLVRPPVAPYIAPGQQAMGVGGPAPPPVYGAYQAPPPQPQPQYGGGQPGYGGQPAYPPPQQQYPPPPGWKQ
ncbi:hypothetical protein N2152v2_001566 [Parachlorella kessleri]